MNDRLREFLVAENKSSAQLADEIGVQPSGISHILSGRNKPSLDFVIKMLEKYQYLSTEWLLFGNGSMYNESKVQTLFDEDPDSMLDTGAKKTINETIETASESDFLNESEDEILRDYSVSANGRANAARKIVWFYEDGSFEEYFPR